MKLLRLEIVGFGRLTEETVELSAGLNVLCQDNGWGKSTLAVFIKAMLYGLPASRKTSLDENERKKYRPWQGGRYGGSLEFSTARGSFRVERFFGAKETEDSFALFDLATNKPSDVYRDAPLGMELFGVDEEGFERSVYLSQRQLSPKKENGSIHAKLSAALENVEDLSDFDRAIELLDKRRKYYQLKGDRGAVSELQTSLGETLRRVERSREAAEALQVRRGELRTHEEARRRRSEELETLGKQRARLALREARASLEKEKNDRLARLSQLAERRTEEEAFFAGQIPDEAELRRAVHWMDLLEKKRWQCSSLRAPFAGEAELSSLRRSFPSGVPTEEELAALEQAHRRITAATARKEALLATMDGVGEGALGQGMPSEESLQRAERLAQRCALLDEVRTSSDRSGKKGGGLLPSALLTTVAGLLLGVLGCLWLSESRGLPLLIGGGGLLLSGIVLWLLRAVGRSRQRSEAKKREEDYRRVRGELLSFLLPYGVPTADPVAEIRRLRATVDRYEKSRGALERYDREIRSAGQQARELLARRGERSSDCEALPETVADLRRRRERLLLLQQEQADYLSRRREAEEERARIEAELHPFLQRYSALAGMSEKEALAEVIRRRDGLLRTCAEMQSREQELRRFIAENLPSDAEDGEVLPSVEENRARSELCRTEIAAHEEAIDRLRAEVRRLEEDAAALGELSARAEREERTLAEYRANAATIQTTARILTEARDALSTRYLAGMQESFQSAMAQLPEGTLPEARLDSSFEVLTRSYGEIHPEESLSRGLRDAVQFCVRLALVKALFAEGEPPFLLLDDPFVNLDDRRLSAVKEMLERFSGEYQILHLVCSAARL